ncbi:MAG: pyruvate kinase [Candidatus Latescibacterota bacterium]|nr:MAG: pyruvate kinase [Candidatus Latescibacterota bacterium]
MYMKRTKIVCTIGPSSEDVGTIEKMIEAGMNVARINFSHGTRKEHSEQIAAVREASKRTGTPVAVLQDLSGPKVRVGELPGLLRLVPGEELVLTSKDVPGEGEVPVSYKGLPRDLSPGDIILLADGEMTLKVKATTETDVLCEVLVGGELSSHKGINVPGVSLGVPSVTDKDLEDLEFGIKHGVDWVAVSFVRGPEDVRRVKDEARRRGKEVPVIAKVEKHEALRAIDGILKEADGVMVARGDLGVEIPLEEVPIAQKEIIKKANEHGKPVVTATQMLLSMVESPRPTRAEVTDIANAIFDGTDAVMLSEETAVGRYPVEAVRMMAEVALRAEEGIDYIAQLQARSITEEPDVPDAISHAACHIALNIKAEAIICCTHSGQTARMVAKYRPHAPIIAVTPSEEVKRRLTLFWGIYPTKIEEPPDTDTLIERAKEAALRSGLVSKGARVVIVAGVPVGVPGATNLIKADVL